jgi:hypothetical protein
MELDRSQPGRLEIVKVRDDNPEGSTRIPARKQEHSHTPQPVGLGSPIVKNGDGYFSQDLPPHSRSMRLKAGRLADQRHQIPRADEGTVTNTETGFAYRPTVINFTHA